MRWVHSLLLSVCFLVLACQSKAAGMPEKQTHALTYCVEAVGTSSEGLNDYHQVPSFSVRSTASNRTLQEAAVYPCVSVSRCCIPRVLNYRFHNIRSILSEEYAKSFRATLIFPQHYYW